MLYSLALTIILAAFAYLSWRNFRAALILFCGLLPTYLIRFSIGPYPSTMLETLTIILFIIWLSRHSYLVFWQDKNFLSTNAKRWQLAFLFLLASAFFAAAHAPNVFAALGILKAYYLEPLIIGAITLSTFKKPADWAAAFFSLSVSAVLISIFGIFQYFTALGLPTAWLAERRITSVFDFPNAVGLFLAPILSMLIVVLATHKQLSSKLKLSLISSTILILIAIILAKTEAALVAVPIALLITLLIGKAHRTTKLVSVTLIILALIGALSLPSIKSKILLTDLSGTARTQMWHETLTMLRDHPIFGAGLSGFPTVISPYHDASYFEIFQYPHNIFLNIWVELGLPGLLAFFIISLLTLKTLWQHRQNPKALILLAAFLTIVIHGLVDVPFFKNDLAMLTALLLAATISLNSQQSHTLPLAS